jgi:hypothetical protein
MIAEKTKEKILNNPCIIKIIVVILKSRQQGTSKKCIKVLRKQLTNER